METTVRLIDPMKDPRWDKFVESHPFGWVCHLSSWKRIIEMSFQHMTGYYFALTDESGTEILAGLPIFTVKSWITGNRLVSIPYATLCDPLISKSDDLNCLLRSSISLSNETKSAFIEIRTASSSSLIKNNQLGKAAFYRHHSLLLNDTPERLKTKFHRTCVRQRINRAIKSDLKLRVGKTISDLEKFYQLHLISRRRLRLPPQPYLFFKALWETLTPAKQLTMLLVKSNGSYIAGLLLLKFRDRVSAEFAVSDENYKHLSPNHFLFWEAINMSYGEGYKIFDFGRTSPSNKTLMDFKERWGTTITNLPQYYYPHQVAHGLIESENTIRYKVIRKICGILPESSFKNLGNFCYRHLG